MKRHILCLLSLIPAFSLPGMADGVFSVDKNSILVIEQDCKLKFNVNYRSEKTRYAAYTQNPHYRYAPQIETKDSTITAKAFMKKSGLPDSGIIYSRHSAAEWSAEFRLEYPNGFKLNFAALELELPLRKMEGKILEYNGKKYTFPSELNKKHGYAFGSLKDVSEFTLPLTKGFLTISFPERQTLVQLNDNRFFGAYLQHYSCRIPMKTENGKSTISLRLKYTPYRMTTVSLKPCANRTFADSKADDRLGGWTDQGPEQDMSPLKPGKLEAGPAVFKIASDKEGNSCLVLGGGGLQWLPKQAEMKLPEMKAASIFLLHSLAWAPTGKQQIGMLELQYTDGTGSRFPIINRQDVANWWSPAQSWENGQLVWKEKIMNLGELRVIGLFMSVFHPDPAKTVASVRFLSTGKSVWMIAGLTLSPQKITLARNNSTAFTMKRSKAWPLYKPCLTVEPGSALDFSFLQDAPAGKYGRVIAGKDGNFRFAGKPGKIFHIWGTNLCFATSMMDKEKTEKLVRNLRAFGYNAVRLHHFDIILAGWGNMTAAINPERLDALHYLLAQLKKAGIYYSLDLYTARSFDIKKVPGVTWDPEVSYYTGFSKDIYNLAAMLLKPVRDDLKQFTRNLLLPVNPYTGLAIKDDPALISISILNENSMLVTLMHPLSIAKEQYLKEFEKYAKANGLVLNGKNWELEFRKFGMKIYGEYYKDMSHFLRREIGTDALLTDQNFLGYPNLTFQRLDYDFVDEHLYCGRNTLRTRFSCLNGSARRVFGKPFQISEFNFSYPAPNRSEGGLIYPAMAALQDWNGLYRFCHANRDDLIFSPKTGLEMWDMVNDPARNIPERIAAMIFLRRDVAPLEDSVATAVGAGSSFEPFQRYYPTNTGALVFSAKTGSVAVSGDGRSFRNPLPPKTTGIVDISTEYNPGVSPALPVIKGNDKTAMEQFAKQKKYTLHEKADTAVSSTGEILADFKNGTFRLVTPRTEGFFFDRKGRLDGDCLSAESDSQATIAATSLDGRQLTESERILIIHVTDMQNEGNVYTDNSMETLLKSVHRQRPVSILFRSAQAEITFRTRLENPKLYALDCSGKRIGKVKYRHTAKGIAFQAKTDRDGTACFAYELLK